MRQFVLASALILGIASCAEPPKTAVSFSGQTMGTTYNVSVLNGIVNVSTLQAEADQLLQDVNQSLSTYIDTSLISHLNAATDVTTNHPVDNHFIDVYTASHAIYESTDGSFNPAVGPLVTAWGFGPEKAEEVTEDQVEKLLSLIDFETFKLDTSTSTISKEKEGAQLDFSAIAKGYGVDVLGEMLEARGISDYLVEIGGEVRSKGMHPAGRPWRIGIDKPTETPGEQREIQMAIEIQNKAMATSGNYRNFYVRDGKKYVHTINPFTGYPEESELLSVSVLAEDCMTADAYATAFMVMGFEKALATAEMMPNLEAYFITTGDAGAYVETKTEGFPDAFTMEQETTGDVE